MPLDGVPCIHKIIVFLDKSFYLCVTEMFFIKQFRRLIQKVGISFILIISTMPYNEFALPAAGLNIYLGEVHSS